MKKEFDRCPSTIDEAELYGFSWMENVLAIPAPLVLVTSYKENGKQNATMQSWNTFTSSFTGDGGFCCVFTSVNKHTHMYASLRQTKECVINFPSKENFMKCMATIQNNEFEDDEITRAGLTAEPAAKVNAPRVKECFLNLECKYVWEKDLIPGGDHVVMCVKVVNICMDEEHYNTAKKGRYGETGYLYNIHSPRNPDTGEMTDTCVGIIQKLADYDQL